MVKLAEKASATTVASGALSFICDSGGTLLDRTEAQARYEEVWDMLEEATELDDIEKMMDFFREHIRFRRYLGHSRPEAEETFMLDIVEIVGLSWEMSASTRA